jgi:Fe-S oxidoreductase
VPDVIKPEVLWACTTCAACHQECPVFISYIDKIVDMRRHLVMERGEFPEQLQNMFQGLETVGNPYSFANDERAAWAAGLDVPLRADKPDAEWLLWVGCAPSFDDRARKIARATAALLLEAGVDFAILGPEETCNGDPARRAGNEYLFQMLAQQNIETLNNYNVKRIVTMCPHCFHTLKNEYPDFGGHYEVVHHSELLAELVRQGRLTPKHPVNATVAYHDACYLGRHNDVYDPPRAVLQRIPGLTLVEAAECRDRAMCCSAGGAQMWKEEEHGTARVNHTRTNQLLKVLPAVGDPTIATTCPFCMTMLTDGLADQGHENVATLDIAEILHRAVCGPAVTAAGTAESS